MRAVTLICILLLAGPMSVSAQRPDSLGVVVANARSADTGTLVLAGMAGMIAGGFGGGLIGSQIDHDTGLDDAEGIVIGGLVGTTLLIPTAVHLANDDRGHLGRSLMISTLSGGVLLALGVSTESAAFILAIPVVQLVASIAVERKTSHPPPR